MRRFIFFIFFILPSWSLFAHIGSLNTLYDGQAGPYQISAVIHHSTVVPGNVELTVRVKGDRQIDKVTAIALRNDEGKINILPSDILERSPEEKNLFYKSFLIMTRGEYLFKINIDGDLGDGEVLVPYESISLTVATMPLWLKLFVGIITLFTVVFLFSLAYKLGCNALLGEREPNLEDRRRGRLFQWLSALFILLVLLKFYYDYRIAMNVIASKQFEKIHFETTFQYSDHIPLLTIRIDDPRWKKEFKQDPIRDGFRPLEPYWTSNLLPERGKWMHLFLVRIPSLDIMAHLHPKKVDDSTFIVQLPPLPQGEYALYADIVHENGFPSTLTTTVNVPEKMTVPDRSDKGLYWDNDNSWSELVELQRTDSDQFPLSEHYTMKWLNPQKKVAINQELNFQFDVLDKSNHPVEIMPYIGMLGHAALRSEDGRVFMHLHPVGTISIASQESLEDGGKKPADHHQKGRTIVSFPFILSTAGKYRIWVQVKINDHIYTGVFDFEAT